ncbi:ORF6N domain-containing protein [[Ruminococcus] torques]|uniref:ORF6N domain-containing protein n=1 Tax=[Ruminococcus] torques TaxID=33039 RepID=UPI0027B944C0|nr:ORF6N domain-containing protein [[Ruminococcus] torques]
MQLPQTMEVKGFRVLTTRQLADAYGTTKDKIIYNFNYNKDKYVLGKHYIEVMGEELRRLKRTCENQMSLKYAKSLYLWTEKGALLHAKSLNTDKAWEVYDYLVDFYFRAKEERKVPVTVETKPAPVQEKKKQELPQIDNPIRMLKVLLKVAEDRGIKVDSFPFGTVDSMLKDNHIGIRTQVTVEKACYELAWELSHAFIHYQKGDLIKSPLSKDYNEQATRAANMVMEILNVKMSQV